MTIFMREEIRHSRSAMEIKFSHSNHLNRTRAARSTTATISESFYLAENERCLAGARPRGCCRATRAWAFSALAGRRPA